MADIVSKFKRSEIMSKIKSKDTKPEILVRKILFSQGFRYRLHQKDLPGNPDIVLTKYKTVIFVHGCFWHSHNCLKGTSKPQTNNEFWEKKIANNIKRDLVVNQALKKSDWKVITIWECQTKKLNALKETLLDLLPRKESTVR